MKIGIDASRLYKAHKTGTETYAYNLTVELLKLPIEAEWLLYTNSPLPEELLSINSRTRQILNPQQRLWSIFGLAQAIKKEPVDIILNLATPQPLGVKTPSLTVIHGLEFEHVPQNYSLFAFWHLVLSTWWAKKKSECIITPTEATRQDLISMYQVPENKVHTIHSGLPANIPGQKKNEISALVKDLTNTSYILWIGRKEYRKNVDTLIYAFNELKKEHTFAPVQLIIAGQKGHGYSFVKDALKDIAHRETVHNLDYITEAEKKALFENAQMFVFPSLAEGFGFPVLEAQSYTVPVIASDIPSLKEVAGGGAVFVDPANVHQISQAMRELLTNQDMRQKFVQAGSSNLERFSFQHTAQEVYQHILSILT
jgi:glycosyltransferase involved in cell wall biosynthesis